MVNTQYLEDKIKDSGKKKVYLAEKLGFDRSYLFKKIHNQVEFKLNEVEILCDELGITSMSEKEEIFFYKPCHENE